MTQPAAGFYREAKLTADSMTSVWACCPFCQNVNIHVVPGTALKPVRLVLTLTCPNCNVRESYAPQG